MRQTFFNTLTKVARRDKNVYLLSANLGFKLFDEFRVRCPKQFIDVGVAEANMIGIACGLSLSGKNVYCYSIIPFLLMRAYEQIRMDIAYHRLNVKLIGAGGGFTYGMEGFSHYGIEDLSLMRSMPFMNVVVPADHKSAEQLAKQSYEFPSPLYIRLGRTGDPVVYSKNLKIRIGKGNILAKGKDVVIFAIGSIIYQLQQAIPLLKKNRISATLIDMHSLRPLDHDLIKDCSRNYKAIFTVEEHSITGGLGSSVAEVLAECRYQGIFHRIGIPEKLLPIVGHTDYLRRAYGLDSSGIAKTVARIVTEDSSNV